MGSGKGRGKDDWGVAQYIDGLLFNIYCIRVKESLQNHTRDQRGIKPSCRVILIINESLRLEDQGTMALVLVQCLKELIKLTEC